MRKYFTHTDRADSGSIDPESDYGNNTAVVPLRLKRIGPCEFLLKRMHLPNNRAQNNNGRFIPRSFNTVRLWIGSINRCTSMEYCVYSFSSRGRKRFRVNLIDGPRYSAKRSFIFFCQTRCSIVFHISRMVEDRGKIVSTNERCLYYCSMMTINGLIVDERHILFEVSGR